MTDDGELLRRYAEERSEEAFAAFVHRHIGLVYHAALRQGADAHRAHDIAQEVFRDAARKAAALSGRPAIAGWLHAAARYACLRSNRAEARRARREREAGAMSAPDPAWERVRPEIDGALARLPELEREAVLLRFFEEQPFAEVGRRLGLSEDAARMRVARALDKMRRVLGPAGAGSAALAATLEAQAAPAVPPALAAAVAAAAGSVPPQAAVLALMSMSKVQIVVVAGVLALGTAGLVVQHRENVRLRAAVARLEPAARENARLRAENERFARDARAAAPPAQGPAAAPAARASSAYGHASVPLAPGLVPVEGLGNQGRGSARAAFATQLWAARTGDIALESSVLTFGPEARARLEALAATLPDALRQQYGTPELLMAYMLAGSPHPVGGMEVLGETADSPDDVMLQVQWQHVDDAIVHQTSAELRQEPDGWKFVVPLGLVNRAASYLTSTLAAPAGP